MIVAIDGPAGSGKSTVAKALARRLGIGYLDTGAMYRSVALAAKRAGHSLDDDEAVASLARAVTIDLELTPPSDIPTRVTLDGADVTLAIRTPEIDAAVSEVARMPAVREAMVAQQRAVATHGDLVAEGRDIGTVVFPDADVKVYLTADPETRARRRHAELAARGEIVQEEAVHAGIMARDHKDSSREASPLSVAPDAIELDTTGLGAEEVVDRVAAMVARARGERA